MMWGNDIASFSAFGWVYMVLWWALVVVGIVILVRWLMEQGHTDKNRSEESALEILKKRYAKGEIDTEEFQEKKKNLA